MEPQTEPNRIWNDRGISRCTASRTKHYVTGCLRTEAIQKRLLSETDLTLANAAKIAQGMKAATLKGSSFINLLVVLVGGSNPAHDVERLTTHTPSECRFKDAEWGTHRSQTPERRQEEHMVRIWCKKAKGNRTLIQKNYTYTSSRKHAQALSRYLTFSGRGHRGCSLRRY